jgi:hypothetical protein
MPRRNPLTEGIEGMAYSWGDLFPHIERELRLGWRREQVIAQINQKQIAQAQPERQTVDGLGQVTMSVDPTLYHKWGQRLGYDCWKDKQFRKEVMRDNPEVRVKSRPAKTKVQGIVLPYHDRKIVNEGKKLIKKYG